ncbi:MAG: 30S ribosomal protein S16 [Polyangiales bacterium]
MVRIRLARTGAKRRPFYHIVVADGQRPRDGRFIERVGYYDPKLPITSAHVDHARVSYWRSQGAIESTRVQHIVREHRKSSAGTAAVPTAKAGAAPATDGNPSTTAAPAA